MQKTKGKIMLIAMIVVLVLMFDAQLLANAVASNSAERPLRARHLSASDYDHSWSQEARERLREQVRNDNNYWLWIVSEEIEDEILQRCHDRSCPGFVTYTPPRTQWHQPSRREREESGSPARCNLHNPDATHHDYGTMAHFRKEIDEAEREGLINHNQLTDIGQRIISRAKQVALNKFDEIQAQTIMHRNELERDTRLCVANGCSPQEMERHMEIKLRAFDAKFRNIGLYSAMVVGDALSLNIDNDFARWFASTTQEEVRDPHSFGGRRTVAHKVLYSNTKEQNERSFRLFREASLAVVNVLHESQSAERRRQEQFLRERGLLD